MVLAAIAWSSAHGLRVARSPRRCRPQSLIRLGCRLLLRRRQYHRRHARESAGRLRFGRPPVSWRVRLLLALDEFLFEDLPRYGRLLSIWASAGALWFLWLDYL